MTLCSDHSIQTPSKICSDRNVNDILMVYMESSEHNGAYIFSPICINRLIFGKRTFFIFFFSEYANQSHNFANLVFPDVTVLFPVVFQVTRLN